MTHQRQVILEEVMKAKTHPTADEVYGLVRRRLPRISLGTVYRNLDVLSKIGFIKKIDPGYHQMRFDGNIKDHYHINCMNCGRIEDVPVDEPDQSLDDLEKALIKITEYSISGHNLEFFGLCPKCMKEGISTLGEKIKELGH
jgi:Fur family ferric uptake transcriptional regulator